MADDFSHDTVECPFCQRVVWTPPGDPRREKWCEHTVVVGSVQEYEPPYSLYPRVEHRWFDRIAEWVPEKYQQSLSQCTVREWPTDARFARHLEFSGAHGLGDDPFRFAAGAFTEDAEELRRHFEELDRREVLEWRRQWQACESLSEMESLLLNASSSRWMQFGRACIRMFLLPKLSPSFGEQVLRLAARPEWGQRNGREVRDLERAVNRDEVEYKLCASQSTRQTRKAARSALHIMRFERSHSVRESVRVARREIPHGDIPSLMRCVFGNPFETAEFDPAWRTADVLAVASGVKDDNGPPVLADLLEEAGCTSASLLNHLRDGEHHCRECWALDLVRGGEQAAPMLPHAA